MTDTAKIEPPRKLIRKVGFGSRIQAGVQPATVQSGTDEFIRLLLDAPTIIGGVRKPPTRWQRFKNRWAWRIQRARERLGELIAGRRFEE